MEKDPFDEFDMKPLTDGLGFHKKTTQLGRIMEKVTKDSMGANLPGRLPADLLEGSSKKTFDDIFPSFNQLEKKGVTFVNEYKSSTKTQGKAQRKGEKPLGMTAIPGAPPLQRSHGVFQESRVVQKKERSSSLELKAIPLSLLSLSLDLMVAAATSLTFLLCFLVVNEVSLSQLTANAQVSFNTQLSLGLMCWSVFIIYAVSIRSYFGRTLGEWTFECQLGRDQQIKQSHYPLLVLWRSVIVSLSLLLLPILSLVTKRDLTYYLTGLQLYRES